MCNALPVGLSPVKRTVDGRQPFLGKAEALLNDDCWASCLTRRLMMHTHREPSSCLAIIWYTDTKQVAREQRFIRKRENKNERCNRTKNWVWTSQYNFPIFIFKGNHSARITKDILHHWCSATQKLNIYRERSKNEGYALNHTRKFT